MKMLPQIKHNLMRLNYLYVFKDSFGDVCFLCKYNLLKEKNVSIIHGCHFYIYIYYCSTFTSLTLTILFVKKL
jgi:hypothetical protein